MKTGNTVSTRFSLLSTLIPFPNTIKCSIEIRDLSQHEEIWPITFHPPGAWRRAWFDKAVGKGQRLRSASSCQRSLPQRRHYCCWRVCYSFTPYSANKQANVFATPACCTPDRSSHAQLPLTFRNPVMPCAAERPTSGARPAA